MGLGPGFVPKGVRSKNNLKIKNSYKVTEGPGIFVKGDILFL